MQLVLSLATSSHTGAERLEAEIAQRAVVRRLAPLVDVAELRELLVVVEQAAAAGERQVEPPQAEVVAPPFHQHGRELARDHAFEQRQVLADELFLQADRVRRDDDLRPGRRCVAIAARPALRLQFGRRQNRRHQIGKALADAGARLDHQDAASRRSPARPRRPSPAAAADARSAAAAPQCDPSGPRCRRQKASCRKRSREPTMQE